MTKNDSNDNRASHGYVTNIEDLDAEHPFGNYNCVAMHGRIVALQIYSESLGGGRSPGADIREFSAGARHRMLKYLDSCTAAYEVLITLTYPHGSGNYNNPMGAKQDLRRFIQELRRDVRRRYDHELGRWSVFWCMEFQRNGSVHFHLLSTHPHSRRWVAQTWFRICSTDDYRHLQAGTRIESIRQGRSGMRNYLVKYAAKKESKLLPEGVENPGRFWGVSGRRNVVEAVTYIAAHKAAHPLVAHAVKALESFLIDQIHLATLTPTKSSSPFRHVFRAESAQIQQRVANYIARIRAAQELSRNQFLSPDDAARLLATVDAAGVHLDLD